MAQVIVVGGGLSGLSAAHTVLEHGGNVLVVDKNSFLGGNSTKATSGINGALTKTQIKLGIKDSDEVFYEDTIKSAKTRARPEIARVLTGLSAPAVEWLQAKFALDLSLISRLGGHSFPRTHRGKERFPGMTITYALMEKLEEICKTDPHRARIITKARVTRLLQDADGSVAGVEYEHDGKLLTEYGPVVIATGGYAADFSENSLLRRYRPDICHLPTTNGDHCTGDGIKFAEAIGASSIDMDAVQVHPTGLVDPKEPEAHIKFLAAEALRGVGGLILDANGQRFCNELGTRDYVTGEMWKNKGPFYLVLNSAGGKEIEWHCKHYTGRGLMKGYPSAEAFAKDIGLSPAVLEETFRKYNDVAKNDNDPWGKKYFQNMPFEMKDNFHVSIIVPVVHYCMGGLEISPRSEVVSKAGKPIPGLWAAGEVCGGVHGQNRLGGSSLLDCVVFGRVCGEQSAKYLLETLIKRSAAGGEGPRAGGRAAAASRRLAAISSHLSHAPSVIISHPSIETQVAVDPHGRRIAVEVSWFDGSEPKIASTPSAGTPEASAPAEAPAAPAAPAPAKVDRTRVYTLEEVAKHNTEKDCWVIVNGQVLDVTSFLKDHPGGKKAVLLFAGKDASAEFNMLHKPDVVDKYAPESIIGTIAGGSAASSH